MKLNFAKILLAISVAAVASVSLAQGGGGGGGQGRGGGQRGGRADSSGYYLLGRAEVQTELKITDEQKTKLTDIQTKMGEQSQAARQEANGDQAAMQAAMTKIQAEAKTARDAILTADQKKRLREISIQVNGMGSVLFPDVAKDLAITPEQTTKIADLKKTHDDANASIRAKITSGELDRATAAPERKKNDDTLNSEIEKLLTDDQKTKLKAMGGAAFKLATGGGG